MIIQVAKIGQVVRATRDIPLSNNIHIKVLSSSSPPVLSKGTEAEVIAVGLQDIDVNCKTGVGHGPQAWGLKIRVAKVVWGISFH